MFIWLEVHKHIKFGLRIFVNILKSGASYGFFANCNLFLFVLFHQEERATAQYMEALQFQGSEQWDKAEDIYQNLLESDVLSKVETKEKIHNLYDHLLNIIYYMFLCTVCSIFTVVMLTTYNIIC